MQAMTHKAEFDSAPAYVEPVRKIGKKDADDAIIAKAIAIMERRMQRSARMVFTSPGAVKGYMTTTMSLRIGAKDHEEFGVMFLDAQNRLITTDVMFRGTLTQTSVYPREVVKGALTHQAASVVLFHNHPSGTTQPSRADEALTQTLKAALALVDCRVLDHIIVAGMDSLSMAEKGLL